MSINARRKASLRAMNLGTWLGGDEIVCKACKKGLSLCHCDVSRGVQNPVGEIGETLGGRIVRSVRFPFRIFNWPRQQEGLVKRFAQSNSSGNVALQKSDHGGACSHSLVGGRDAPRNGQRYTDYPVQMGQARSAVEVNNRHWDGLQGYNLVPEGQHSEFRLGGFGHDGSCTIFKWDNYKGCMVPFESSMLLGETSGPALGGNEPLTRSHLRGPDGAGASAQSINSASGAMLIAAPSRVAVSPGEETRSHHSSSGFAFKRSDLAQALIDVAAALAFLFVGSALVGAVLVVLFVLFLVTS